MGQIRVPDVLNNENCTAHPNIELSVLYFQNIRDLNLPPISALPSMTNVSGTNAPSSIIYNLYVFEMDKDNSSEVLDPAVKTELILGTTPSKREEIFFLAARWRKQINRVT